MSRFWTSDLHFFHARITEVTNRHLETTKEDHNEWLIDLINSQVNPRDTVYHLGDFCFKHDELGYLEKSLNGHWVHILGNHDNPGRMAEVYGTGNVHEMHRTTIAGNKVELCHYPWESWRSQQHGSWHLHGHCHGNLKRQVGRRLDVGLDSVYKLFGEHRLLTDEDIAVYMALRPIYASDHHGEKHGG